MSVDTVNMKVPVELAKKLDKIAKGKDRLKSWAAEAREILAAAAAAAGA